MRASLCGARFSFTYIMGKKFSTAFPLDYPQTEEYLLTPILRFIILSFTYVLIEFWRRKPESGKGKTILCGK